MVESSVAEKDVEAIYFNEERIDAIDLFSGELVELDEIESLWLLEGGMASLVFRGVDGRGVKILKTIFKTEVQRMRSIPLGGDGSGGG